MPANRLAEETSPYLLQHKDNPVHWQAWSDDTLALARDAGKPILLSVGYAACHWCHVMAHESFEDAETAAVMNDLFVNVKVDREERPDIDAIYQMALAMLGEHGGWPLTMFLTPDGHPFWGGTYFPPAPRYGRPGFRDVLVQVAAAYRERPEAVEKNVGALKEGLERLAHPAGGQAITEAATDQVAGRFLGEVDPVNGGVGGAPKFPQVPVLLLLWRAAKRTGKEPFFRAVTTTLERMAQGGIYDHLGGGFARYTVEERWLVPHFEKMLYDNAQLLELMTTVWQESRAPLLAQRVAETIGWLEREMLVDGAFASSLDADSEGEEGRYYVWSAEEIDSLLGAEEAAVFKSVYDVTSAGNWEGKTILNRLQDTRLGAEALERRLAACRQRLLAHRQTRVPPGRDDKVLADWNGLAIAAIADAGWVFQRPDWLALAHRAFAFVAARMVMDGRLRHSWRDGRARPPATIDDLAAMARAGIRLFEVTADQACLDQAIAWVGEADRFHRQPGGGYAFAAADTSDLIARMVHANDAATPSGNGMMVEVLARLHALTGEPRWREAAEQTVAAFAGELERNFFPLTTLLNANELLNTATQIVVACEPGSPDGEALLDVLRGLSLPNRVLRLVEPGAALPSAHPAAGKGLVDGRAAAYVCRGQTCSLPVTEPGALLDALVQR